MGEGAVAIGDEAGEGEAGERASHNPDGHQRKRLVKDPRNMMLD